MITAIVMMGLFLYAFLCMTAIAFGQAPIEPPPLPVNATGWADFFVKEFPKIIGVALPIVGVILRAKGMPLIARIPPAWAPILTTVLSTILSMLAAYTSGQLMDGGGVSVSMAAVEGGGAALGTHLGVNQVVKKVEASNE